MECHLKSSDAAWTCSISLRFDYDVDGRKYSSPQLVKFADRLTDKTVVRSLLERAQQAILSPWRNAAEFLGDSANTSTRSPMTFSRNCVCISVEGRGVPDLLFYDLPGSC